MFETLYIIGVLTVIAVSAYTGRNRLRSPPSLRRRPRPRRDLRGFSPGYIGIEPGPDFVAPVMALDSIPAEPDE